MAFWPGGTSLCPWSVLWSGGLTMGSDRRRPPTSGGIRRGKSTVWKEPPGEERPWQGRGDACAGSSSQGQLLMCIGKESWVR